MNHFTLDVVTPDSTVFSGEVNKVIVPSSTGQLAILPRHASLFSVLENGEVLVTQNAKVISFAIGGGFIQVSPNRTTILVTRAQNASELNESQIQAAIQRAKDALSQKPVGLDRSTATALLHASLTDLKILRRLKNKHL